MAIDMLMPKMGESIAEATIVKWCKQVGDTIKKDEIVLEISTDKVDSEIPAPASGVLTEILFVADDVVEVGTVIARIGAKGETGGARGDASAGPAKASQPAKAPARAAAPAAAGAQTAVAVAAAPSGHHAGPVPRTDGRRFYSPVVRAIAKEKRIELAEIAAIAGSGKDGRVTKRDLLAWLETRGAEAAPIAARPGLGAAKTLEKLGIDPHRVEVIKMNSMRKAIARGMRHTIETAAHVQQVHEVDLTRIVAFREGVKQRFKDEYGFSLTYTAFLVEAACRGIEQFPMINSVVNGDEIIIKKYINFGIAVALEGGGLIVPNVKEAQDLNLVGIARAIADVGGRAHQGKLTPEDTADGTFTLTNVGSLGPLFGLPLINQPESAIMGAGKIVKRPVMVDSGTWGFRDMIYLSLSFDHRVIDGALAARFMSAVEEQLANYDIEALGLERRLTS